MYSDQILLMVGGCTWRFDCIILKQRHNFENAFCFFVDFFVCFFFWGGRVGGGGGVLTTGKRQLYLYVEVFFRFRHQTYNHH